MLNMTNLLCKETILCFPFIILLILIILIELMTFYECENIVKLLNRLISIFAPSNFLILSLLPGYFITIFMEKTNEILYYRITFNHINPIIKTHTKMWNLLYDIYYGNCINIILPLLNVGYIMLNIKYISNAIYTHEWILLFPFISSNLMLYCTIIIGTLLYFYYESLNNIYDIHTELNTNNSNINSLSLELSIINHITDNDGIDRIQNRLLTIQETLIKEKTKSNELKNYYTKETYFLDYTLKTFTVACVLFICC